ncbi:hypothetical protein GCK32_009093 [Trichostrongylus colubriformis]|uniref:DUF1279 domain-containing protein n=1 Tax=Trichostrongylus colubriformis TaxID=6319 RepID=A0AAN8G067_TRICO
MLNLWRCNSRVAVNCYRSLLCSELPLSSSLYRGKLLCAPIRKSAAFLHTSPYAFDEEKKNRWPFHVTMTDEQKRKKQEKIEEMKEEKEPETLFGKVKFYLKRYWYIAVPVHMVCCTAWLAGLYALVHCGVDVVALLRTLHMPAVIIEKIESVPPSAGVIVVALILYKIATPLRYMTTLLLIQATFWTLRRMGKLRTAREVEFKVRSEYEKNKLKYGRRFYRYRNMGVRDILRKNRGSTSKDDSHSSDRKD